MKRTGLLLGIITLVTIGLSLMQIIVSNAFSTDGIQLGNMQKRLSLLENENLILRQQVFSLSSYTHIASSASSMGFEEGKNQLVLSADKPLAIRR